MASSEEIERYLLDRILNIYLRPLMFAGSPRDLEVMLGTYHEILDLCTDSDDCYWKCRERFDKGEGANSISFYEEAKMEKPGADRFEIADFIVRRFVAIDHELKIPLPFDEFRANGPWMKDPAHPIAFRFLSLMSQWKGNTGTGNS